MVRYLISVAVTIAFGMILGFWVTTNAATVLGVLLLLAFALAMCWVSALIEMMKTAQGALATLARRMTWRPNSSPT